MMTWGESLRKIRRQSRLGGIVTDALFASPKAAPASVLVVDDEETVRRFVARVLQEAGCDVVTAADGPEAIAIAEGAGTIDLLVTDLMMPQMNGDELARRLRKRDGDLPVLYLTGFSDRLFAERMTLWDREAFLDKPCTINGLLEAVSLLTSGGINCTVSRRPRPDVAATGAALDVGTSNEQHVVAAWLVTVR